MLATAAIEEVKKAFVQCLHRYPTIQLAFEDYLSHVEDIVAGRLGLSSPDLQECREWLACFARLHSVDVFLALACSRGDRIAWEYFADDYLPLLQRFAVQACRSFNENEDLAQEIIARLMEGKEKLAGYNGSASLAGWLRVALSNTAIDRFRRARRQVPLDSVEEGQQGAAAPVSGQFGHDSEERLDARWGPVLSQILTEEIGRLSPRDRLLLNLYYLQEVPLKIIGRQFHVHEATVSRWLQNLRRGIRKRIEKELHRRHGLRPREIQSLWHWVSEQEGFSLHRIMNSRS